MDKAKEIIKCPGCKGTQISLFKHCFAIKGFMINPKTLEITCFGEGDYDEFEGLWCKCHDCKNEWKSRKYKNLEDCIV